MGEFSFSHPPTACYGFSSPLLSWSSVRVTEPRQSVSFSSSFPSVHRQLDTAQAREQSSSHRSSKQRAPTDFRAVLEYLKQPSGNQNARKFSRMVTCLWVQIFAVETRQVFISNSVSRVCVCVSRLCRLSSPVSAMSMSTRNRWCPVALLSFLSNAEGVFPAGSSPFTLPVLSLIVLGRGLV